MHPGLARVQCYYFLLVDHNPYDCISSFPFRILPMTKEVFCHLSLALVHSSVPTPFHCTEINSLRLHALPQRKCVFKSGRGHLKINAAEIFSLCPNPTRAKKLGPLIIYFPSLYALPTFCILGEGRSLLYSIFSGK
jgi:hypothetical protein